MDENASWVARRIREKGVPNLQTNSFAFQVANNVTTDEFYVQRTVQCLATLAQATLESINTQSSNEPFVEILRDETIDDK